MFRKQFYFEVSPLPAWADTLYAVAQSLSKLFKPDFNICGKESSIFWLKLTFSTWGGWQQKVLNQLPLVRTKAINHFYIHIFTYSQFVLPSKCCYFSQLSAPLSDSWSLNWESWKLHVFVPVNFLNKRCNIDQKCIYSMRLIFHGIFSPQLLLDRRLLYLPT